MIMPLSLDEFELQLAMLLQNRPAGTVAVLTECLASYWSGKKLVYVFLRDDRPNSLGEEFDLRHFLWRPWEEPFEAWLASPRFRRNAEVIERLNRARVNEH
ncbi:hypothetical protein J2794_005800 [Paraburkholderia terricola]|jgi:hypothetical protein|uniref:hypothetical protein n=1 Tax=Paraburkholderia terricola TaxID=169427 RepID=UPI0028628B3C|nr:hypothetical protein [Paraburkholderia terricola]MDR6449662.1 hypothetical protein [Paraburkholderia terricola]